MLLQSCLVADHGLHGRCFASVTAYLQLSLCDEISASLKLGVNSLAFVIRLKVPFGSFTVSTEGAGVGRANLFNHEREGFTP